MEKTLDIEFVPYEIACSLKKIGFDEECIRYYTTGGLSSIKAIHLSDFSINQNSHFNDPICSAPMYQQIFRWFREKHQLFAEIEVDATSYPKYCFSTLRFTGNPKDLTERQWGWDSLLLGTEWTLYRTHQETELECIKKLIEIVKGEKEFEWKDLS